MKILKLKKNFELSLRIKLQMHRDLWKLENTISEIKTKNGSKAYELWFRVFGIYSKRRVKDITQREARENTYTHGYIPRE